MMVAVWLLFPQVFASIRDQVDRDADAARASRLLSLYYQLTEYSAHNTVFLEGIKTETARIEDLHEKIKGEENASC